jgi:hypothetical protein
VRHRLAGVSFRAGPRVRIRLPPAVSPPRT